MSEDQIPLVRSSFRTHPGMDPAMNRSFGRRIWMGTTRFFSFLGGAGRPFAEAWNLAGGPGGQGAVVLANFLQKFGHPAVQHVNEKVALPRVSASPYSGIEAFNQISNNSLFMTTENMKTMENVLSTRYDLMVGASEKIY